MRTIRVAGLTDRSGSKYHHHSETLGLTVERFVETYPCVIRLRPTRWLTWGGPGWVSRDAEPRAGAQTLCKWPRCS